MRLLLIGLVLLSLVACTTRQTGPLNREQAAVAAGANTEIASYHLRRGNLSAARSRIQRALEQDPRSVEAHLVSAELWTRLADATRAERHYRKALSFDRRPAAALNNYATFLCRQDRLDTAIDRWEEAAADRLYAHRAMALSNAAQCLNDRGNPVQAGQAADYWRKALTLQPGYPPALRGLAEWSLARGHTRAAGDWYSRYTERVEDSASGLWLGIRIARAANHAERQGRLTARLRELFPASRQAARLTE
jgi:type IV pilus assembly protein PilF